MSATEGEFLPAITMIEPPAIIHTAGPNAGNRFAEYFTVHIQNPHTRAAYARAVAQFLAWCEIQGTTLRQVEPMLVAAYVEQLQQTKSKPTVKQHLAALRMLFDWLVTGQIIETNPAASVRGPKHVAHEGKTAAFDKAQVQHLLKSIDTAHIVGLRDKTLLMVLTYTAARAGAVAKLKIGDYYSDGSQWWFHFGEKGGKVHQVPARHDLQVQMQTYIAAAGIAGQPDKTPLFRSAMKRKRALTTRTLTGNDLLRIVKRRLRPPVCRKGRFPVTRSAPPRRRTSSSTTSPANRSSNSSATPTPAPPTSTTAAPGRSAAESSI